MLEQLLPEVFERSHLINNRQRRLDLVKAMAESDKAGFSCANCIGNCCTFSSNSMRITPLEAVEILSFLENEERISIELMKNLDRVVSEYRLETETYFGIKKNYTCPFYLGHRKGCSISRWSKPYGCLAFNSTKLNVTKGEDCRSDQVSLQKRNARFYQHEEDLNLYIKRILKLSWNKESIPVALLDILKKGELCSPQDI